MEEYTQKFEESPWYLECKYNTQFIDNIKNKTKNLTTKHNPGKTIVASNKRYDYMQITTFMISIKGEIRKML